jgi:photosystem II stability/assembly factor-like uncharacterized protein
MKKIVLIILVVIQYLLSQSGWEITQGNQFNKNIKIFFTDSLHGYILGTDVYRTYDGGNSWDKTYSYNSNYAAVAVLDSITWIRGGSAWSVEKTTNSGKDWIPKTVNWIGKDPMTIQAIVFDQQGIGWAIGGKYLLKSIDNGDNWSFQDSSDFTFWNLGIKDKKGIIIGTDLSILLSYDGGGHWYKKKIPASAYKGVYIKDSSNILIGGYDGLVLYSTNGGEDWTEVKNNLHYKDIYSFFFISANIGWAVGSNGLIMHTTNYGKSWEEQYSNTQIVLRSIFFMDSIKGWVVGDSGTVLETSNGGVITSVAEAMDKFSMRTLHTLYQNNPNPFNPSTEICFNIREYHPLTLKVYDFLGREIVTLLNTIAQPGNHTILFNGSNLNSGIYVYVLFVGNTKSIKKMILVK